MLKALPNNSVDVLKALLMHTAMHLEDLVSFGIVVNKRSYNAVGMKKP